MKKNGLVPDLEKLIKVNSTIINAFVLIAYKISYHSKAIIKRENGEGGNWNEESKLGNL